jgi:predicted DNA-binding transcriptional regulator YafY
MPRLGKKNRAARIPSAARTRTLHSLPPLYRFQEIFHAIKTGRYPNRTKLADATVFSELAKAIQNKELVEFGYKKLDAKVFEKRTVEPWHLACISGQWYLLGHDRRRNARRIFVLARMQKVSRTGQKFSNSRPGEGDIQRLFRNSFQIWQSENAELGQIVLRFSGRAAQLVRERNWHSSQQIQELAGGNLELSLTLNSLEELVPWILSWGKDCEVVRPTRLWKEVRSLPV